MKSFLDWLKEEKLEISSQEIISQDATDTVEAPEVEDNLETAETEEKTVEEKTKRTGLSANYPPAYVSSQYPHKHFNPTKATADLDIENMKKKD